MPRREPAVTEQRTDVVVIGGGLVGVCSAPELAGDACVGTTPGTVIAGQVVLANGAWSPALAHDVGLRLPI